VDDADAARIDEIMAARAVPEPYATALREVDCGELVDDWRLCITLLWIVADDMSRFGQLNGSMGIASGRIRTLLDSLRAGGYLVGDHGDHQLPGHFALTTKGRLSADVLRARQRIN